MSKFYSIFIDQDAIIVHFQILCWTSHIFNNFICMNPIRIIFCKYYKFSLLLQPLVFCCPFPTASNPFRA